MQEVLDKKRRQEDEEKLAKVVLLEAFLKQLKEKHESVSLLTVHTTLKTIAYPLMLDYYKAPGANGSYWKWSSSNQGAASSSRG